MVIIVDGHDVDAGGGGSSGGHVEMLVVISA